MMTAKDVMTRELLTVTPATPLREFARLCAEDNVSGAPVVRVDGALVGIISRTDLMRRLLEDDPMFGGSSPAEGLPSIGEDNRQVADVMETKVVSVAPDTPVHEVAELMVEDRIHRVLVVENDEPVGIITSLDLLAHYPEP
ncbi:MAG: CBS domain-containing protein [Planctomycetota bacterium]|nr:CBS domain-containing protein [Planctomycetota bacterium]